MKSTEKYVGTRVIFISYALFIVRTHFRRPALDTDQRMGRSGTGSIEIRSNTRRPFIGHRLVHAYRNLVRDLARGITGSGHFSMLPTISLQERLNFLPHSTKIERHFFPSSAYLCGSPCQVSDHDPKPRSQKPTKGARTMSNSPQN